MNYTTDDALNILWRCGIQTQPTLMKLLNRGKFQASERTIEKKMAKLKVGEVLEDHRKSNGRTPFLNESKLKRPKEVHQANPTATAGELGRKAKLKCSARTVSRGLLKLGLEYRRIRTIPLLTLDQKAKRVEFAESHKGDRAWRKTFFLDGVTFKVFGGKKYCYQYPDQRLTKPQPKHPLKIHGIAMISFQGPTRLLLFECNLIAERFIGFFRILLEDAKELNSTSTLRVYFDNDLKHKAEIAKRLLGSNKLNAPSDWPSVSVSASPHLNPIENVWARVGMEIQKFIPKTLADLQKRLRAIWKQKVQRLLWGCCWLYGQDEGCYWACWLQDPLLIIFFSVKIFILSESMSRCVS